jgi:hypothetical protein
MKMKKVTSEFFVTFAVVFVVSMVIELLFNILVYRTSMVNGELGLRTALTLSISLALLRLWGKK